MKRHIIELTQLAWIRRASLALAVLVLTAGSLVVAGTEALARAGETLEVEDLSDAVAIIQAPVRNMAAPKTDALADTEIVTIRGRVTNEKGMPLAGVNIFIPGTNVGSATGPEGNYVLVFKGRPTRLTLVFSNVGRETVQVNDVKGNRVDVTMKEKVVDLSGQGQQGAEVKRETPVGQVPVSPNNEVFVIVENQPEYPGGIDALKEYLRLHFKYPESSRQAGAVGRVFVTFIVDKEGSIQNVEVARGVDPGCDQEAVRVLEQMPKWNPGKQRGQRVNVRYSMPVDCKP